MQRLPHFVFFCPSSESDEWGSSSFVFNFDRSQSSEPVTYSLLSGMSPVGALGEADSAFLREAV